MLANMIGQINRGPNPVSEKAGLREVPQQLEELAKGLERVNLRIAELEERLGPVLGCPPPESEEAGKECRKLVPLAAQLESAVRCVADLAGRLERLTVRVQL